MVMTKIKLTDTIDIIVTLVISCPEMIFLNSDNLNCANKIHEKSIFLVVFLALKNAKITRF